MDKDNKEKFTPEDQENKNDQKDFASRNQYSGSGDFSPDDLENPEEEEANFKTTADGQQSDFDTNESDSNEKKSNQKSSFDDF